MYSFSLATCLFLAFIACVRETKKVSDFVALYFANCKFVRAPVCDKRSQESGQI